MRAGYQFRPGRPKDLIVSSGENIYLAEVENALMPHPAIADGAVIGIPDEKWGEPVKAIDCVEAIPRNPSGKRLKRLLREPCRTGRDRNI